MKEIASVEENYIIDMLRPTSYQLGRVGHNIIAPLRALCEYYVVASYCLRWHYRLDEQILLQSNYRQIL